METELKELPDLSKFHLKTNFISFEYPMHLICPIQGQKLKAGSDTIYILSDLSLLEVATALRTDTRSKDIGHSFMQHQQRFKSYKALYILFSWVAYLLIATLAFLILGVGAAVAFELPESLPSSILIPFFVAVYFIYKLASRIVSALFDRTYADTLSFVTCLYLLAALAKENSLADPKRRKQLLDRTRALRKYLVLLPYQFSAAHLPSNGWALTQFRSMSQFVDDQENQIIAPQTHSQTVLFGALQTLLQVLLTRNYGEFKYQGSTGLGTAASPATERTRFAGLLKFLGTITPLILLLSILLFPGQLRFLGIENSVISYISLAWLLLAIDANLKLGIVQGISSLAKTIKDLS